jgi:hypothetical protein
MTTKSLNPTTRETSAFVRERGMRPLMATLHGSLLLLRPKGLRSLEVLDLGAAWSLAVKQRVNREQAEKRAARKARRAA